MPGLVVGAIWSWILAGDHGVPNPILGWPGMIRNPLWTPDPGLSI